MRKRRFLDVLRSRASDSEHDSAFVFLADGETESERLTHADLHRRARTIAAALASEVRAGERVLLLYPPGLEFVAAFLGCLYAAVIAVPTPPPRPRRKDSRLLSIVEDAAPCLALTDSRSLSTYQRWMPEAHLRWLATDQMPETEWEGEPPHPDAPAFLQYTSGSTGTPKGVIVSHANLLHNEQAIKSAFGQDESSVVVGWLPLYHDMGLIGNVLQPLFNGSCCILMSPTAFLQRPRRWLEAVSRYRGTTSGGPNFAFDLCVDRIGGAEREGLDLSSWALAFNGSEPVRAATLDRFAQAFGPCGFRPEALFPCYGLAEATLFVSGRRYRAGTPAASTDSLGSSAPVSCGVPCDGQNLVVAVPETLEEVEPGEVGEILVSGPSVTQGYWHQPAATESTFRVRLARTGKRTFLRTGDLGFIRDGQIFVAGRLKDLIIVRGRNYYPQDLEQTIRGSHPSFRAGMGAAFAVAAEGAEAVGAVQEADPRGLGDGTAALEAARFAVAEEHGLALHALLLVKPGAVPRTSSGKVQRHLCRHLFLEEGFKPLAAWQLGTSAQRQPAPLELPPSPGIADLEAWLRQALARRLGLATDRLDPRQPLLHQGVDSLAAVELGHDVEAELGVSLPIGSLLDGASLAELAEHLHALAATAMASEPSPPAAEEGIQPLSVGQRAIWFLQAVDPGGTAYVLAGAGRLHGVTDADVLRASFGELVRRHDALRTTFPLQRGEPVRWISQGGQGVFFEVDATDWGEGEFEARLSDEAHRPFDLERGPLLRVSLFWTAGPPVLLVAVHHIVADFWSIELLARELGAIYERLTGGGGLPFDQRSGSSYGDFVRWQRRHLISSAGEKDFDYWRRQVGSSLPILDLPLDRPRPRQQSFRGAACGQRLAPELLSSLRSLGRDQSATLFMVLLSGFQALLHRYTNQSDLAVGSPASGRTAGELGAIVGYLVNPVVLRSRCDGNESYTEFLSRVRESVIEALDHQAYPFPLLAERLQPERDPSRSPLFQALFVHHRSAADAPNIAGLALGQPEGRLDLGTLVFEPVRVETRASQVDLTLRLAELGDLLAVQLVHDTALFDGSSAKRILGHYVALLGSIAANPERSLRDLSLLSRAERHQVVIEWNDGPSEYPRTACTYDLFARQAARTPHATAVEVGEHRLSYGELRQRAGDLARTLRGNGVGPEACVGVFTERTADLVVCVLAVMEAGGVIVPLDSIYPLDRLRQICRDSHMGWILGADAAADLVRELGAEAPLLVHPRAQKFLDVRPDNDRGPLPEGLAYLLYTSGSSGQPKGVAVPHRALVNLLTGLVPRLGVTSGDAVSSFTTLCFDIGIFEILLPLVTGGRLILLPTELAADGQLLARNLSASAPTVVQATPATWELLLDAGWVGSSTVRALCGGEALSRTLADSLRARTGGAWNMYGPTEATVYACIHELSEAVLAPPIGRPVANTRLFVLDGGLRPMPPGAVGELFIAGEGLARGYWARPDLTAVGFLPDPHATEPGGRMYRTGDQVRLRRDGLIEYLGRLDSQIKIRGFRVELDEVRSQLSLHPGVGDAVVIGRADQRVVAYFVPASGSSPTVGELQRFLLARLPRYMVPAAFVQLAALPLTPNGKVDRKALPPPSGLRPEMEVRFVAPRTPREEVLAGLWADLLELDRVGAHDNFFQLGGHSLKAAQVVARIRELFQVDLPLLALFHAPTVEALSREIATAQPFAETPTGSVMYAFPPGALVPASFAQARIWFLDRMWPGTAVYNMPLAVDLTGEIKVPALAASLAALVERHGILRTVFPDTAGQPLQTALTGTFRALPLADLSALPGHRGRAEARRLEQAEARRPFDLERGPIFRTALLRLDRVAHVLLVNVHHIAADGASLEIFLRELGELYSGAIEGRPAALPALKLQYADYADWERRQGAPTALLSWWRERLGPLSPLDLPTDRPRPPVRSARGGVARLDLGLKSTSSAMRRQGFTPFVVLCAALTALLYRYTGSRRIPIGAPVDVRDRAELEPIVGVFVNLLVLAVPVSGSLRCAELLSGLRNELLTAYEHRTLPFELLAEELRPRIAQSHDPLIQATVAFERAVSLPSLPNLELEIRRLETGTAKFDLSLTVSESTADWVACLEYTTDLFDATTAVRLLGHLSYVLQAVLGSQDLTLSAVPLLNGIEQHQLVVEWNDTVVAPVSLENVCDLFERQAKQTPGAAALIAGDRAWSYCDLNLWANRIAHHLRTLGVDAEVPVAVCIPRGPEMVAASLAVLKAGGGYLSLDPAHPAERLREMVADAGAPLVLTLTHWSEGFLESRATPICIDRLPEMPRFEQGPQRTLLLANLAYVIYTSGSSGTPKGVAVSHAGLLNLVRWHQRNFSIRSADCATQLASPAFDASVWEVWPYLTAGASLKFIGQGVDEIVTSPEALRSWLVDSELDLAFLPTPLAEAILALPAPAELGLRALLTGGDRLRTAAPASGPRVVNHYGPTEGCVVATAGNVEIDLGQRAAPSIGRPIDNVQVFLTDNDLRPVPIGVAGEIHLGGQGLARSYVRRPDLTAEAFIPSPFAGKPGARLYRTGDRARLRADGSLDFLGRLDLQVKIRGFRVELSEIEVQLLRHPGVREAVALVRDDAARGQSLAVAFVPADGEKPDPLSLRAFLGKLLPPYMVPSLFVPLDHLPLTSNGKIDREALETLEWAGAGEVDGAAGPRTPFEVALAAVWAEVLGVETVALQDDFFALGGHSLKAARLAARIRDGLGMEMPLRRVFEASTLASMAAWLARSQAEVSGLGEELPLERRSSSTDPYPLSPGQRQLWIMEQIEPGSALFHLPAALDCRGSLDRSALERTFGAIVRRHEILRTRFPLKGGSPIQVPVPFETLILPLIDLSALPEAARISEVDRRTASEARQPFDLEHGQVLRAALLQLAPNRHRLLLTLHHIAADAWSVGLLVGELERLYSAFVAGRDASLPDLRLQYADFALWQRDRLRDGALDSYLRYWTERLGAEVPTLELPADRPRPPRQTRRGSRRAVRLRREETRELKRATSQAGATLFMGVLAVLQVLLQRHTGSDDVVVGTAIADRPDPRLEELIGYFLNTLVLRGNLASDLPFVDHLLRTRETVLGALAHAALPFERLVEALQPDRDLSRGPLFQVFFALTDPLPVPELPGLTLQPVETSSGASQFDLALLLSDSETELHGWIEFNPDLFDATTVERMAAHLGMLVRSASAGNRRLSELPLLDQAELHQLLTAWNDTGSPLPGAAGVYELFANQVARTPEAIAVVYRESQLTYRDLAVRAESVARRLRHRGVAPGDRVAVCLDRSPELLAALFGVLAVGAAYLPLDPSLPPVRLASMLEDAGVATVVMRRGGQHLPAPCPALMVDGEDETIDDEPLPEAVREAPAYLIYTSGSTGRPKAVVVTARNVLNLFGAMNGILGGDAPGVWLAVTGISFDISVLELLWTLSHGYTVVLQEDSRTLVAPLETPVGGARPLDFSLFYFADAGESADRYRLLLEGARFADDHGFLAVWTPERHFHSFGGLYPNPAVTGAAVAAVTRKVGIRAGSVVLPLHDPLRVAEEWSVVDNLSHGRVGISFASGWHADDFVLAPDAYAGRHETLLREIETVRQLWRGEAMQRRGGAGNQIQVRIHPRPIQAELPLWLTAAGSEETFRQAGRLGANLLTHLLGQSLEELTAKIAAYREARRDVGHDPDSGVVTLMLHTYVGRDEAEVRARVRAPLTRYLRSSVTLMDSLARSLGLGLDAASLSEQDMAALLDHAFERYYSTSALLGTRWECRRTVERLRAIGVNEIGCLIDFGVEVDAVLESLPELAALRQDVLRSSDGAADSSLAAQISRHGVTHLQCTPSLAGVLAANPRSRAALRPLRKLLVGGEALSAQLAEQLAEAVSGEVLNMYGPTETTVWSLSAPIRCGERVTIGRPLRNTGVYLLDARLNPVPMGAAGEVWLSGEGVTSGYWRRPDLTAERFLPDPFTVSPGGRLYRTGDLARLLPDGRLHFLGRLDYQAKIRGHRVEPAEVENALLLHQAVADAVVVARKEPGREARLVAYVVPAAGRLAVPSRLERRSDLASELPRFVLPNGMVITYLSDFQVRTGYQEIFEEEIYLRHGIELPDGACIFDVGANIGLFSLWVHGRCRDPRVFAYEPMPQTFRTLRANLALYELDVHAFNQGMGESPGRAEFGFYPNAPGLSGRFAGSDEDRAENRAIVRDWLRGLGDADSTLPSSELEKILDEQLRAEICTCELVTLSDVIRENGVERIHLLKVDVEKSELDVLRGILDEDWERIDQIVLEVHTRGLLEEISRLLVSHRFHLAVEDVVVVDSDGVHVHMVYAVSERLRPATGRGGRAVGLTPAELRQHLLQHLPEPMVPSGFVMLDSLPRTSNGKLDRRALPAPSTGPPMDGVYLRPSTRLEMSLAVVWQEVLGRDRIGIHDNFFEVGGSSLLLLQVQARMRQALGRDVELVEMFRHPTIHSLARALSRDEDVVDLAKGGERGRQQAEVTEHSAALLRQRQFLENRKRQKAARGRPETAER